MRTKLVHVDYISGTDQVKGDYDDELSHIVSFCHYADRRIVRPNLKA